MSHEVFVPIEYPPNAKYTGSVRVPPRVSSIAAQNKIQMQTRKTKALFQLSNDR
jgi:hypothetical protein